MGSSCTGTTSTCPSAALPADVPDSFFGLAPVTLHGRGELHNPSVAMTEGMVKWAT